MSFLIKEASEGCYYPKFYLPIYFDPLRNKTICCFFLFTPFVLFYYVLRNKFWWTWNRIISKAFKEKYPPKHYRWITKQEIIDNTQNILEESLPIGMIVPRYLMEQMVEALVEVNMPGKIK